MSIDCHVYCGPYLACKFHLIEREVAPASPEVIVCPRCGAAPRGSSFVAAKFCPACGSALEKRPAPPARKMIPSVDFHDLRDFIDERLYVPFGNSTLDARMIERLTHYWLPNRSGDGVGVLLDPRRDMTVPSDVSPEMIEREKQRFASYYRDEIQVIRARYNDRPDHPTVTVEWGLFVWQD